MYQLNNIVAVRPDKTVYRDNDKTIKVFNQSYSTSSVLNEALNLSRVGETGILVPKLHAVTLINGNWAIVTDYIEGKSLMELLDNGEMSQRDVIVKMIEVQCGILSKTQPLLSRLIDKMHYKICETDFDATIRYELHMRLKHMKRHTKICHGDLCPSNIIVTTGGEYYTIDWSHVTQGNASADVARSYLTFNLNGRTDMAEQYLSTYCETTGLSQKLVQNWFPIVAASQSVKKNAGESELLHKWVKTIEYE